MLPPEALYFWENLEDWFSMSESQTAALIFNLKFANINFLAFANEAGETRGTDIIQILMRDRFSR